MCHSYLKSGSSVSSKAGLLLGRQCGPEKRAQAYNQSEWGSNPSLTCMGCVGSKSLPFSFLICNRILLLPPPSSPLASYICEIHDRAHRKCPEQCLASRRVTIHANFLHFFFPVTLRLKLEVLTIQWTGPSWQVGTGMIWLTLKRWLNCLTMANTYNKPTPQMFYLVSRPYWACILLPPWAWGSAMLLHTEKIGSALSLTQSCFLCPLPEDGNVTRARELHNAQRFMKIRIWKRECCAESGRVGRPGAREQLELVCNNSVLFYSIA